jgi:signal transduction histidine kinase
MVRFQPGELVPRVFVPPVYITAFKKFDHEVSFPFEISQLDCVEISYRDNFFAFEFAALDYTVPEKNQYAYKLDGFDEDWVFSGSRRYASYTNLDGGTYRFMVKAANSDGVWNEHPTQITVVVRPPFWKTIWFELLAAMGVLGLVYGFYWSRLRMMHNRNLMLERKVRERTSLIEEKSRELEIKNEQIRLQQDKLIESEKLSSLGRLIGGMSHEINNPLNFTYGNAVNLELELQDLQKEILDVLPSHLPLEGLQHKFKEMEDMLRTIKMGTERIKDIVVGLRDFAIMYDSETADIHLNTLVDHLVGILRSQEHQHVDIRKEYQELPPIRGLYGQLSHAIMNILRNAVEAAESRSGQTGRGDVLIRTWVQGGRLVLSIRDNGQGIPDEIRTKVFEPFFTTKDVGKGTGLGLSISYGIIRNHKGEISFESELGHGTEFRIELPLESAVG